MLTLSWTEEKITLRDTRSNTFPRCHCLAQEKKEKLGANAMKLVAASAHPPTPWLFEPAKGPDDRIAYSLGFFIWIKRVGEYLMILDNGL